MFFVQVQLEWGSFEEARGKRGQVTILVVSVSCSKLAEFLHVTSISVEKHCYVIFFSLACSLLSRNNVCKKTPQFSKWQSFVYAAFIVWSNKRIFVYLRVFAIELLFFLAWIWA